MTVRRFLRHVGVGAMLAGLVLAIAVVALPAGWMQWRFDREARTVYLQADRGALRIGKVHGAQPVAEWLVPHPSRAKGLGEFLLWQYATNAGPLELFAEGNGGGSRRSTLGVGFERSEIPTSDWSNAGPAYLKRELRLPAWLLALPGLIWLSLRMRRKIVDRPRPKGFDVLPGRDGVSVDGE